MRLETSWTKCDHSPFFRSRSVDSEAMRGHTSAFAAISVHRVIDATVIAQARTDCQPRLRWRAALCAYSKLGRARRGFSPAILPTALPGLPLIDARVPDVRAELLLVPVSPTAHEMNLLGNGHAHTPFDAAARIV